MLGKQRKKNLVRDRQHFNLTLERQHKMATLAEIRARLAQAEVKQGGNSTGGDNSIYPHWNMQEGQSATLRFLPDGNSKNTFFWVERAQIRLPFNGIKGEMNSKQVIVPVPCVEMYGPQEACPILAEVRTWFKDPAMEDLGRKYWKKRSYIFQGFVRENPLADDKTPANPIRRFIIGPQIFTTIKGALMDPELEELPTDYLRGLDFRITKGSKGGFADYNGSKWTRKETALTSEEQAAIDQYGLFDLSSFLPKKPTEVEMNVIKEMFEASVAGESYDTERWGQYFRPAGVNAPTSATTEAQAEPAPAPAAPVATATTSSSFDDEDDTPPVASAPVEVKPSTDKAQDILAMIRARQKQ